MKFEKTIHAIITTVSAIIALIGFAVTAGLLVVLYTTGVIGSSEMGYIDKTVITTVISGGFGGIVYTIVYFELEKVFIKDLCQEDGAD